MSKNEFSVAVDRTRSGQISRLRSILNNVTFGPKLEFRENGKLAIAYIEYDARQVGTNQAWIDTGSKHWECYSTPNLRDATICRDFLIEDLEVDEPFRNWHASNHDFNQANALSQAKANKLGTVLLVDAKAEQDWLLGKLDFAGERIPQWPNGQIAYYGDIGLNAESAGATVTFWPNGAVRTIGHWEDEAVIGTRSCFSEDGHLIAEQYFHRDGFRNGTWLSRFFDWNKESPRLSKVDIYLNFKLHESTADPVINSILDEADFNRFVDPLFQFLNETTDP